MINKANYSDVDYFTVTGPPINEVSKEPNKIKSNENGNNDAQLHEFDANDVLDDTATLMQKVMQEVMHFKQNKLAPLNKAASKVDVNSLIRSTSTIIINNGGEGNKRGVHIKKVSNITRKQMGQQQRDGVRCNTDAELSFSFLDNLNKGLSRNRDTKTLNRSKMFGNQKANTDKAMKTFVNAENDLPYFCRTVNNEKSIDPEGFRPIFSSTPKREEFPNPIDYPKPSIRKSSYQTRSQTTLQRTRRVVKRRPTKIPRNNDKNLRNMSLSSRFFSAINESCTTLVKTVVNIFKKNEPSHCSKDETESHTSRPEDASCSFSFLNYMQKRDAVINKLLKTKNKDCTDFSLATELCETCDTQTLKKKMARNMHLKQTVKKLKMGINLYGCDFKVVTILSQLFTVKHPLSPSFISLTLFFYFRKYQEPCGRENLI